MRRAWPLVSLAVVGLALQAGWVMALLLAGAISMDLRPVGGLASAVLGTAGLVGLVLLLALPVSAGLVAGGMVGRRRGAGRRLNAWLVPVGRLPPLCAALPAAALARTPAEGMVAALLVLWVSTVPRLARHLERALGEASHVRLNAARALGGTPRAILRYALWPSLPRPLLQTALHGASRVGGEVAAVALLLHAPSWPTVQGALFSGTDRATLAASALLLGVLVATPRYLAIRLARQA